MFRSRIVIPLLQTDLLNLSRFELLKQGDDHWSIWEQEELGIRVAFDPDRAVVNPIIDPMLRDLEPLGDLGHGEVARDVSRMRLTPLDEDSVAKADDLDRAGQHDGTLRRPVALLGQVLGDLPIRLPLTGH